MPVSEEIKVSVVMPVYNREAYLAEAIESILNQTFPHFEFIIINDGSTDRTEEIILSYQGKDSRIRYYKNKQNIGNNASRNRGMELATGKYIAIMDSDDIAVPDRLQIQINYLDENPQAGILGGFKIFFDEEGWFLQHYPTNPEYLESFLFFKNAVGQPTVMMRHDMVIANNLFYFQELENMGDYNLWYRATVKGIKIKNIPKVLLYYRLSPSQIGSLRLEDRNRKLVPFFRERLASLNITLSEDKFLLLHKFIRGRMHISKEDFYELKDLLKLIENQNSQLKIYDKTAFRAALFFFRLRLIKYYHLENKKDRKEFITQMIKLSIKTGYKSLIMFWQNEGKYIKISGRKNKKKWQMGSISFSEADSPFL